MPNFADYAEFRPAFTQSHQDVMDQFTQTEVQPDGSTDADGIYRDGDYLIDPYGRREIIRPVIAYMQVAVEEAGKQLDAMGVYPEALEDTTGFENVDPHGNYCRHDLSFAQRMAYIKQAASVSSPEVQAAAAKAEAAFEAGNHGRSNAARLYDQFKDSCEKHRLYTRAAKLCHSETGYNELLQNADNQTKTGAMGAMDETLKGLEYMVGLRKDAPTLTQSKYMEECFGMKPEEVEQLHQSAATKTLNANTSSVPFANFDNTLTHKYLSHPKNWGKTPADAPDGYRSQGVAESDIQKYTATAVKGVMTSLYSATENRHPDSKDPDQINRGKLITVDGKPLSQVMKQRYLAEAQVMKYEEWYKRNLETMSSEIVSAALLAGKRVEAFVTDAKGVISDEPISIVKTGYEPNPLKPVTMNAFQTFMSKHGFYKEKVAQKEEYDRVMASRAQVKTDNIVDRKTEMRGHLRENFVAGYTSRCEQAVEDIPLSSSLSLGRTGVTSLCTGYMMAMGYSAEDVLDPNKLLEEKKKIGELYTDLSQAIQANERREKGKTETQASYDAYLADFDADTPANAMRKRTAQAAQEQVGQMMYIGQKAIVSEFDRRAAGRDLGDLANQPDFITLDFLAASAFDISQNKNSFKSGYTAAAVNDFQSNPTMQARLAATSRFEGYVPGAPLTPQQRTACAEYTDDAANNIAVITDFSMRARFAVSSDFGYGNPVQDGAGCVVAHNMSNYLRAQQRIHPGVAASDLIEHKDFLTLNAQMITTLTHDISGINPQGNATVYNDIRSGRFQNAFRDAPITGDYVANMQAFEKMRDQYIQDSLPEIHQPKQQEKKEAQQKPQLRR